ncbi:MAG: hypothetical protein HC932_00210 [Thermales bacterium]|nr:hypothetical protein [Thermales bacterium]
MTELAGGSANAVELNNNSVEKVSIVKLNSVEELESMVTYNNLEKGTTVELPNGEIITIVGDKNGIIGENTVRAIENRFEDMEQKGNETVKNIQEKAQKILPNFENLPSKIQETHIPLSKDGSMVLVTLEVPNNFEGNLEVSDTAKPETIPVDAQLIVDNLDGVKFYQFQDENGRLQIRAAFDKDEIGTARQIINSKIDFVLRAQDGKPIPVEVSNKVFGDGVTENEIYNSVAAANLDNKNYFVRDNSYNSGLPANALKVSQDVNLRELITRAGEFTASYDNKYKPGTVAFLNIILASNNAKRNELIAAMATDRRHILDNPGEQSGFPNEYREVLRELEGLGMFKEDLNGLKINNVAREVQLDSITTLAQNQLNDQRKMLLDATSEIYKNRANTGVANQNIWRSQAKFFNGDFSRRVALAKTPEELIVLTDELAQARFDFSGADQLSYRAMMRRVEVQTKSFQESVPLINAYIEATGGNDKIVLDENGLVQGVELEKFSSSIGLNLPKLNSVGGVMQALGMAWGIKNGNIPIPLKFESGGKIGFGEFSDEDLAALTDKNNPRYKEVRTGISPSTQKILAPIFKAIGIPFLMTGSIEKTSGYASDVEIVIPQHDASLKWR